MTQQFDAIPSVLKAPSDSPNDLTVVAVDEATVSWV